MCALTRGRVVGVDHLLERGGDEHVALELDQLLVRRLVRRRGARRALRAPPCGRSPRGRRCRTGSRPRPSSRRARPPARPPRRGAARGSCRRCRSPGSRRGCPGTAAPPSAARCGCSRGPPRAVASSRPTEPPTDSGLPVTTPSTEWPTFIEYVSKIQAITCASVPTSGAGNVLLGADLVDDLGRVAAREPLELVRGEALRVADDAALRAAERQPHQRALPRHPHGERLDLVARDGRVVADPALGRPAGHVVHDAIAVEDVDGPVVHRDRDGDLDGLLALRRGRGSGSGRRRTSPPPVPAAPAPARTDSRAGGSASRSRSSGASRLSHGERTVAQHRGGAPAKPERDVDARRRAAADRRPDDADDVLAGRKPCAERPATGEAEGVSPRQHVAQTGEPPDPPSAAVELDVEQLERKELRALSRAVDPPGDEREHGGARVAGPEGSDESRTRLTTGSRVTGTATLHGIRSRGPPRTTAARSAPTSAPGAAGRTAASTVTAISAAAPGCRTTRSRFVVTLTPVVAAPCRRRTTSGLRDTLRSRTVPVAGVPAATSAPSAATGGSATSSTLEAASRSTRPVPAPLTPRRAVATSAPRRPPASRSGRASARSAAAPATTAAAALEPLIVP